jgi:RsmE family RNA methyltransferase
MNLLLLEPDELSAESTVVLHDRRSEHIINVLNSSPGDSVRAGIINGPKGTGEIVAMDNSEVVIRFTAGDESVNLPRVDLILGMVRPIMLKRILAQIASLGVGRIFLINANRVEKSFFEATLLQDENYRPYLLEGLEQARNTYLPEVSIHRRLKPFAEDFIPSVADSYNRMLVAHPGAEKSLKQTIKPAMNGRILLAVGPEGGWVDFELEKFAEQAFISVSMGERILRTETAIVALLSQIMVLSEC